MIRKINKEYDRYIQSKSESQSVDEPRDEADEAADEPAVDEPVEEKKSNIVISKKTRALELLKKKKQKKISGFEKLAETIQKLQNDLIMDVKTLLDTLIGLFEISSVIKNTKSISALKKLTEENITMDFVVGFYEEIMQAYDKIIENKDKIQRSDLLIGLIKGLFGHINHLLNIANEVNINFRNIDKGNTELNEKLEMLIILQANIDISVKELISQI